MRVRIITNSGEIELDGTTAEIAEMKDEMISFLQEGGDQEPDEEIGLSPELAEAMSQAEDAFVERLAAKVAEKSEQLKAAKEMEAASKKAMEELRAKAEEAMKRRQQEAAEQAPIVERQTREAEDAAHGPVDLEEV